MLLTDILDLKGHQVYTAAPEESVMTAVKKLVDHNVGALAVTDAEGRLVGILSERDVLRMLRDDATALDKIRVEERMTRKVIAASPTDQTEQCLDTMTSHRIRHLPVCIEGKLTGMISIGDLVKCQLDDAEFHARHLKTFVTGQYPA